MDFGLCTNTIGAYAMRSCPTAYFKRIGLLERYRLRSLPRVARNPSEIAASREMISIRLV